MQFYTDSQSEEKPSRRSKWKIVSVGFVLVVAGAYASALALAPAWTQNLQARIAQTLPGSDGFVPIPPELSQTMSTDPASAAGTEESRRVLDVNLVTQSIPVEAPDFSKDPEERKNLEFVAETPPVQPTFPAESLGTATVPQPQQETTLQIGAPPKNRTPAATTSPSTLLDRALASIKSYTTSAISSLSKTKEKLVQSTGPRANKTTLYVLDPQDPRDIELDIFVEASRLRGITPKVVRMQMSFEDFIESEFFARVKEENIYPSRQILFPIVEIDGELMGLNQAKEYLRDLPEVPTEESYREPYIYAYGPDNCSTTKNRIRELEAFGLPVEWKNVNEATTRIKFAARLVTLKESSSRGWPLIEIRGKIYPSTLDSAEAKRIFDAP